MKKRYRIRKNQEFKALIAKHNHFVSSAFIIYAQKRIFLNARVGLSVSSKLGNAVKRNKIKRQIRMMLSESFSFDDYNYDIVIICRKNYLFNKYLDNKKDLLKLLRKVKIN